MMRILKKLNAADFFSLYRFVAIPGITASIIKRKRKLTGALLLVSFLTDAIDGFIARKRDIETKHGAVLDSAGDMLTILTGFASFYKFEKGFFKEHKTPMSAILTLFAFQVLLAVVKFKKPTSYHTYLAKLTAGCLAALFILTPLYGPNKKVFYFTITSAALEALEEIAITFYLQEPQDNVRGIIPILLAQNNKK